MGDATQALGSQLPESVGRGHQLNYLLAKVAEARADLAGQTGPGVSVANAKIAARVCLLSCLCEYADALSARHLPVPRRMQNEIRILDNLGCRK